MGWTQVTAYNGWPLRRERKKKLCLRKKNLKKAPPKYFGRAQRIQYAATPIPEDLFSHTHTHTHTRRRSLIHVRRDGGKGPTNTLHLDWANAIGPTKRLDRYFSRSPTLSKQTDEKTHFKSAKKIYFLIEEWQVMDGHQVTLATVTVESQTTSHNTLKIIK